MTGSPARLAAFAVLLAFVAPLSYAQDAKTEKKVEKKKVEKKPDPAFAAVVDDPKLPRVLIIGDSISIGYTLAVRKGLAGKANVHRIPENGGPTITGTAKIDKWLGEGKWDVIHFNWGLHDLKVDTGTHQVPVDKYEANLRELVGKMKKTGAKLIFATTTPVPEGKLNPKRVPSDVDVFNKAALKVMQENGVAIDDLYAFALPQLKDIQIPVNVHFTAKGSEVLAGKVIESIVAALPK